ncbi:hypothetical protein [Streptomyces sp. NPDC058255]|uniref:hypothetical protein n=1 Tax=Streptomyces sp. NPDC058255 TaxID=3346407 RepID=UPI0036E6A56F
MPSARDILTTPRNMSRRAAGERGHLGGRERNTRAAGNGITWQKVADQRVVRGGPPLCRCRCRVPSGNRYRVAVPSRNTPDSSAGRGGFR